MAPLKPLTVPQLELQAAVMVSRLADTIISQHSLKISKRFFWTDSLTVVNWIRSDARKYQPFLAHRLAEILDPTSMHEWRWIATKDNVADEATTDTEHIEITSSCGWFTGPEFLVRGEGECPKVTSHSEAPKEVQKELKREFILVIEEKQSPFIEHSRFSSWTRLICTMARVFRFIEKCRNKSKGVGAKELTASEIAKGEKEVLKLAQRQDFAEEWKRLKQKQDLPSTSEILELSPKLGEDGLLRMNGRIRNETYSQSVREPIILNGKNPIVRLLISFHYNKSGQIGQESIVNDLRSKYWITKIRNTVRSVRFKCLVCRQRKVQPQQPEMGPLPDVRTDLYIAPFTNTGGDYFGPLQVTVE